MSENDRLAEIKARCEAYGVEVKALLAENERLRRDNGSLAKGYAEQLGDRQENIMLRAEVERLRAEVARLEAKSKALRAECSDLWEVIERTKDALRDYDGICLEGAQGAWEILQGALDEEPNNAS